MPKCFAETLNTGTRLRVKAKSRHSQNTKRLTGNTWPALLPITKTHHRSGKIVRNSRIKSPKPKIAAILPADTMLEVYSGPYLNHNGSTD
jgi:hypothetical protein